MVMVNSKIQEKGLLGSGPHQYAVWVQPVSYMKKNKCLSFPKVVLVLEMMLPHQQAMPLKWESINESFGNSCHFH